jgi:hypothetical protein
VIYLKEHSKTKKTKKVKPMYIYVAGPITADVDDNIHDIPRVVYWNVKRAIRVSIELMKKGHYVFTPHLSHFINLEMHEKSFTKEFWYKYDYGWLAKCDALYYIAPSPGADAELEWAKKHKLKIFYSLDEVPDITSKKI